MVGRDYVVRVYSTDAQNLLAELPGHEQTVYRVAFCPNGQQFFTVSADMTVRLWDLKSNQNLFTLTLPASGKKYTLYHFDFRCTPNGCWIAVPLTDGKLALYDLGNPCG